MDLIDRPTLQMGRISAVSQRRCDCRHHHCGDVGNITRSRAVNMAAEDCDDPS